MMGVECKLVVKLDESAMNTIIEQVSIMKPLGWLSKTYIHVKFYNPALQVSNFFSLFFTHIIYVCASPNMENTLQERIQNVY
jgi:hypothetical protein